MTRWEYKVVTGTGPSVDEQMDEMIEEQINELGAQGWEIAYATGVPEGSGSYRVIVFLKRALVEGTGPGFNAGALEG